jgi:hypothetical protein
MADSPSGHESSAIATGRVIWVGSLLAVMVIGLVLLIRVILGGWITAQHAQAVARRAVIPLEPRLQAHPDHDLAALRGQKQALLSTWAWTDSTHEFAHISIERAMVLYQRQHASSSTNQPVDGAR